MTDSSINSNAPISIQPQQQLSEDTNQLKNELGDALGLIGILRNKVREIEEENLDLQVSLTTLEAEKQYEIKTIEESISKQVQSLTSQVNFLTEELKKAQSTNSKLVRNVRDMEQMKKVEENRHEAEKRLLSKKKRRHNETNNPGRSTDFRDDSQVSVQTSVNNNQRPLQANETLDNTQSQNIKNLNLGSFDMPITQEDQQVVYEGKHAVSFMGGSTDSNVVLISKLLSSPSRQLLLLLLGNDNATAKGVKTADSSDYEQKEREDGESKEMLEEKKFNDEEEYTQSSQSYLNSSKRSSNYGTTHSQSVLSQLIESQTQAEEAISTVPYHSPHTSSPVDPKIEHNIIQRKRELGEELYLTISRILSGGQEIEALVPVFIQYFTDKTVTMMAPVNEDFQNYILVYALGVLQQVILNSARFQRFISGKSMEAVLGETKTNGNDTYIHHHRLAMSRNVKFSVSSPPSYFTSGLESERFVEEFSLESECPPQDLLTSVIYVTQTHIGTNANIVQRGIFVLETWADIALQQNSLSLPLSLIVSKGLTQEVLLSPRIKLEIKTRLLKILVRISSFQNVLKEVEAVTQKSKLLHRCANFLVPSASMDTRNREQDQDCDENRNELLFFRLAIIELFIVIIEKLPTRGVQLILESTCDYNKSKSSDDPKSYWLIVFHLVDLLDTEIQKELYEERANPEQIWQQKTQVRHTVVRQAFYLLSNIAFYINFRRDIQSEATISRLQSVLMQLSDVSNAWDIKNDQISETAKVMQRMLWANS